MQVDVINRGLDGVIINPLNAELNPICHLLALLGGATIVVVSRLRVKTHFQRVLQQTSPTLKIVVPFTQRTKTCSLSPPVNVCGYCSTVKMCMCPYIQIH